MIFALGLFTARKEEHAAETMRLRFSALLTLYAYRMERDVLSVNLLDDVG